jgi:hypothetical protein
MAGPHRLTITCNVVPIANGGFAGVADTFKDIGVQNRKDKAMAIFDRLAGSMCSGAHRFGQVDFAIDDSTATPASQTVTYTAPSGAQTITIAGRQVSFTAGADAPTTAAIAVAAIQADTIANRLVRASAAAGVVTLRSNVPPTIAAAANGQTLAATGTGAAVGGATFAGGVNATDTGYAL